MRLQVLGHGFDPPGMTQLIAASRNAAAGGNRPGERFDLAGPHRQPMVGLDARTAQRRLDHVQPVHHRLVGLAARVAYAAGAT